MTSHQPITVDDTFSSRAFSRHSRDPMPTNLTVRWEDEEDTADIDFTTDFQAQIRNAPPRRRKTISSKQKGGSADIKIHEDDEEPTMSLPRIPRAGQHHQRRASILPAAAVSNQPRRGSMLGQPAQRIPIAAEVDPIKRRTSIVLGSMENESRYTSRVENTVSTNVDIRRAARRRSAAFQSSIGNVTRGNTSTDRSDNTVEIITVPGKYDLMALSEEETEDQVQRQPKRLPRKSLSAAPKKGILQRSAKIMQEKAVQYDIPGTGGGKENLIPMESKKVQTVSGKTIDSQVKSRASEHSKPSLNRQSMSGMTQKPVQKSSVSAMATIVEDQTSDSPQRRKRGCNSSITDSKRVKVTETRSRSEANPINRNSSQSKFSSNISTTTNPAKAQTVPLLQQKAPTRLAIPAVLQLAQSQQQAYPVLSDDIAHPELYEDNWLSHQEIAITQLLNGLFATAKEQPDGVSAGNRSLRKDLLELYHQPSVPLLYKRVQASLLYGALAVPKETIIRNLRLQDDIGLRRKFLDLWLDTYEPNALKAAAEVVFGRELTLVKRLSDSQSKPGKRQRKSLELFLETFLVRHEDAVSHKTSVGSIGSIARGRLGGSKNDGAATPGTPAWAWSRTILRSLMLILLLDMSKTQKKVKDCLFLSSSPRKSSLTVLQSLGSLMFPSMGDILRPLGHLNYQITHVQYPLEEYDYSITNLATDMRDGVRLTRIVELLLYPSTAVVRDRDVTITMPTGDILVGSRENSWVLSHHLRVPCASRAQKVFNTQIALSALSSISKGPIALRNVAAENFVDGHREKSLSLLWSLVTRWGICLIIDDKALRREIRAIEKSCPVKSSRSDEDDDYSSDFDEEEYKTLDELEKYTYLLKMWATVIARKSGLQVDNLSTSFADGQLFGKIVDEYETYLPSSEEITSRQSGSTTTLEAKLRRLGCSASFAALFKVPLSSDPASGNVTGFVLDREFVLAALTFLCSRLLPLSVRARAAVQIQTAFRRHQLRKTAHKRLLLLRLAHDCATVVQTRDRVVSAAVVIQRAYKAYLGRKIDSLVHSVTIVQAVARGGIMRRNQRGFWK
jgi:abnormal spindle-like microcephaly-associated protein